MKNISLNNLSKRIIYVDLMRAFAVIMMIQGHTVDTLLADQFRNTDYLGYNIWNTMRGFTAPIFMFTAGLIFTYLLKSDHFEFSKNPRVKKGIKKRIFINWNWLFASISNRKNCGLLKCYSSSMEYFLFC